MSTIDISKLLAPISEDAPCGEDLEYDPEFGELERAAQGKLGRDAKFDDGRGLHD